MGKFRAFAFIERKMEAKPLNSAVRAPTLELFMAVMNAVCFAGVVKRVGSSNNVFGGMESWVSLTRQATAFSQSSCKSHNNDKFASMWLMWFTQATSTSQESF